MEAYKWAIITALVWGVVPVLEKTGLGKVEPLTGLFFRCCGVLLGLFLLGVVILRPQQIKNVDLSSALILVLSGFLASFVAQVAFYHGLKIGDVSRVVPVAASFPMIAFVLGVLFLGESFSFLKLTGMGLVLAGVWLLKM
jgi:transporter family protein